MTWTFWSYRVWEWEIRLVITPDRAAALADLGRHHRPGAGKQ